MAEVATAKPSQTSASGPTITASSPALFHSGPTPLAQQLQPSQQPQLPVHGQEQLLAEHLPSVSALPRYSASSSPTGTGDGNATSAFPLHWTQSGQMRFTSPDSTLSRELPPIISSSPIIGISQTSQDIRQPVSPRTVALGMNDSGQDLGAFSSDITAPRKRSKVSRACDECRRKKVPLSMKLYSFPFISLLCYLFGRLFFHFHYLLLLHLLLLS